MPDHDKWTESRRRFLKTATGSVAAVALLGLIPRRARAADLPHLSLDDPTAKALQYTEDASSVKNPLYKPGDTCANCQFYQGASGDEFGPCQLFPGKAVHANGWCVSHAVKK